MLNNNPLSLMQTLGSNPLFQRAQAMSQGKSQQEILQIAKNICAEKGINIDEAYATFKKQYMN